MSPDTPSKDERNFVATAHTKKLKNICIRISEDDFVRLSFALAYELGNKAMSPEDQQLHTLLAQKLATWRVQLKGKRMFKPRKNKQPQQQSEVTQDATEPTRPEPTATTI